jgi:peptide chain release factor subunit 3
MSDLNSWEDESAGQDDQLSRQTQQNLHINNPQAGSFRPGANSFQPGAQSFQPGGQYPQYGGGYDQSQYYQQGYSQQQNYGYQQPAQPQQGYGQYNQYGQGTYNNTYGQQQYGTYNQQQQAPQQTPAIAKRPSEASSTSAASGGENGVAAPAPKPAVKSEGGAKVLSIGGDTTPKPKVLSLSATTPASESKKATPIAEDGAKVAATKAIEKTEKPADGSLSPGPSSGKSSPARADSKPVGRKADAVVEEQAADVDEETLDEVYGKEHVNLIFIGHVDAGKSTLGGSILYATGMVDERTIEKYKKEAKDASRESWYLSWVMDLTKEERSKGKTVEVGRGFFETERRRYTILDAPGHKTYVPNMIGGASQADVGVLVISARKGEYETGFEKGGQTREHAMLAKTQGVNKLIIAVNKMDDPTVEWSKDRYEECTTKLTAFLKGTGYNPKTGKTRRILSAFVSDTSQISNSCPYLPRPAWVSKTVCQRR